MHRLIPWSDESFGSVKSVFVNYDVSVLDPNGDGAHSGLIEGNGSRCSSNTSGASSNKSLSSQYDAILGDYKKLLVIGDLGEYF